MHRVPIIWTGRGRELSVEWQLSKRGDEVALFGVLVGLPGSTLTLHTGVTHAAPATRSETLIHAILFGDARIDYDGLVSMPAGVAGSSGTLHVRAITIGETARISAVPRLEIIENQVSASHGVAVSRFDDRQLFYLESRGLTQDEAIRLILTGFADTILSRLGDAAATRRIHRSIESGLHVSSLLSHA